MDERLKKLTEHKPKLIGMEECRKAAVCIPLMKGRDGYQILFEMRSANITHQPGDICLPGGMVEEGETPQEAALRELKEELLVTDDQIELLGKMDILYTASGLMMYSYAVLLENYQGTYSEAEVRETFHVPLDFFLNTEPEIYWVEAEMQPEEGFPFDLIQGGRNYTWRKRREEMVFYRYEDYSIWGLTAKLLQSFIGVLKQEIDKK